MIGADERTVQVDFHFHSNLSDGYFAPEILAEKLAAAGVDYAALTDHDTVAGCEPFRKAAINNGIVPISGVEIFATFNNKEIHLLSYGFDPQNPDIQTLFGKSYSAEQVIRVMQAAGGKVFLAHPFVVTENEEELEKAVKELKKLGLDGLETYYKSYSERQQTVLNEMATRLQLIRCSGSDFHGPGLTGPASPGLKVPHSAWRKFRNSLSGVLPKDIPESPDELPLPKPAKLDWSGFLLRIALPPY